MPDDYRIGYGKPPTHSRFKPGRSGNPKGRPKGTKNLCSDLRDELGELITLREGSRVKRISKQRAIVKSLAAKAIKGDAKAISTVVNLIDRLLGLEPSADGESGRRGSGRGP